METAHQATGTQAAVRRRIDFVLSAEAAQDAALRDAIGSVERAGHLAVLRACADGGDPEQEARAAAEDGADVVAAVGGDGTLNKVVNGVLTSGRDACAVGLVPFGTANDFAAEAGVPADPEMAARVLAGAAPVYIDAGECNGRFFVNVASGGFGAKITSETRADVKEVLGGFAYLATGLSRIGALKPVKLHVRTTSFRWSGDAYAVSVGNGCRAGGGFRICPYARLDDGRLDLVIIPEVPAGELPELIGDFVRLGRHADLEQITYLQTPEVEIRSSGPIHFNLDGEEIEDTAFLVRCHPGRLPFLMPAPAGGGR